MSPRLPLAVAVTGGIASGKSAACSRFAFHGVPVFDADIVARELAAPGAPALVEIRAAFGDDVFAADGTLDRRRMREVVFADDGARRRLEAILHPKVRDRLREQWQAARADYVIVAIPLLVEAGRYDWLDRVLVVDVPVAVQVERLVARDRIDPVLAQRMLAAQASREARLAIADDVVDNAGDLAHLHAQIDALHVAYVNRARTR